MDYDRERERNADRKMKRRGREDDRDYEWGKRDDRDDKDKKDDDRKEKEKPNFGLSGKLAEDTNKVNGVVIKVTYFSLRLDLLSFSLTNFVFFSAVCRTARSTHPQATMAPLPLQRRKVAAYPLHSSPKRLPYWT